MNDAVTETPIPGSTATSNKAPTLKEGDVVHMLAKEFGGMTRLADEDSAYKFAENGDLVITVEVKSVKKAKITLTELP